jgi:hypothetical protein
MGRRYLATLLKMYADRLLVHDDLVADLEAGRRMTARLLSLAAGSESSEDAGPGVAA